MVELVSKTAVINKISNYIDELKRIDNIHMADRIFAANVILDKVRRMEPECTMHIDLAKSNIQIVKNDEELNNE